ncbi:NAD(P)-dependent oxidoreductase [Prevotella sp. 10(H)]|uniref:NAD(P)-dependent oxidoreductase n=1 Tax=Prevotella sp. 10(H) TaxID=1158294 RepID=UPI0004A7128C|nr:NAD(P)H-binding protein [Prevotella sp. 10(H)]
MKVALIGATGFVGSHLLQELINRGYEVTALARSVDKIPVKDGKPKTVAVDVTDVKALTEAIKGSDALVSAFNAGWSNPNIYDDFIKGSEAIQQAAKDAGVKRYITVGGGGSLFIDGKQIVDGPDFPDKFKAGATAARDYLNILKKETTLDWTFVSPALDMFPGERTGKYRLATESPVFNEKGDSVISVQDLAVAIVDELENHKYSRQRFTAGY